MVTFGEFGVNAPKNERVTYRRVTTCAPLDLKDLTKIETQVDPNLGTLEEVESIYAGPTKYGFSPANLTAPTYSRNLRSAIARNSYDLESAFSAAAATWSYWDPIPDFNRTDADVTIMFLTFNNIDFVAQNDDLIFSAHVPFNSSLGVPVWKPDNNISALACAEQHQFCNPNIAEDSPDRFTSLTASELVWGQNHVEDFQLLQDTGLTRLHNTSIHLNPFQEIIAGYSSSALSAGMYFSVFSRGASALKASETVYQYNQSRLPNDQWIVELAGWYTVGLATIQQSTLEYALGPRNLGASGVLVRPAANDTLGQRLCKSQSIRNSGQVQSFSILGMCLILFLGLFIIIISHSIESVVGRLQKRFSRGEDRKVEWKNNEKLKLLANGTKGNVDGAAGVASSTGAKVYQQISSGSKVQTVGGTGGSNTGLVPFQFGFDGGGSNGNSSNAVRSSTA